MTSPAMRPFVPARAAGTVGAPGMVAQFDLDSEFAEAMRRIMVGIERRYQLAMGRKPSTANRSAAAMYRKPKQ